jgi:hypothetical protein
MFIRLIAVLVALAVLRADAQTIAFLGPGLDVEAQGWWTPAGGGHTMHVHLGSGNSPLYRRITGRVGYDVNIKLHLASGLIGALSSTFAPVLRGTLLRGVPTSIVEERTFPTISDTTATTTDGWKMFTIQTVFTDAGDGMRRLVRLRGYTQVANGNPASDNRAKDLVISSWIAPSDFEGRGYSSVLLHRDDIPFGPVSGIWQPRVKVGSSQRGQRRHMFASIDPDFHNGRRGLVVFEQPNQAPDWVTLRIDTRALTNGRHRLLVKASDAGMFPSGALEGALVVGFTVAN